MKSFDEMKRFLLKKENMVVLILVGVLLMVIAIPTDSLSKKEANQEKSDKEVNVEAQTSTDAGTEGVAVESDMEAYTEYLEQKVADTLGCMEGVGGVKVMITLTSSREVVVEKDVPTTRNTITENDSQGGEPQYQ